MQRETISTASARGTRAPDLYNAVQKAVDAARAEGADYVVALGHLGIDEQSSPWTSTEVIANTTGIDVLIDGHSHSTFEKTEKNKDGEDVVVAQTGTKLENLGKVVIDTATGEITSELVAAKDCAAEDEATAAFVKGINDEFAEVLKKVVAKTDVELTTKDPVTGERAVRSAETNLGEPVRRRIPCDAGRGRGVCQRRRRTRGHSRRRHHL